MAAPLGLFQLPVIVQQQILWDGLRDDCFDHGMLEVAFDPNLAIPLLSPAQVTHMEGLIRARVYVFSPENNPQTVTIAQKVYDLVENIKVVYRVKVGVLPKRERVMRMRAAQGIHRPHPFIRDVRVATIVPSCTLHDSNAVLTKLRRFKNLRHLTIDYTDATTYYFTNPATLNLEVRIPTYGEIVVAHARAAVGMRANGALDVARAPGAAIQSVTLLHDWSQDVLMPIPWYALAPSWVAQWSPPEDGHDGHVPDYWNLTRYFRHNGDTWNINPRLTYPNLQTHQPNTWSDGIGNRFRDGSLFM